MSIASQVQRLENAKADLASAIEEKGVSVPETETLDGYGDLVRQIQQPDWNIYVGDDIPPSTIEESMVLWFQPVDDNWEIQPDNWGIYVGTEEPPDEIKATKVLWYQID